MKKIYLLLQDFYQRSLERTGPGPKNSIGNTSKTQQGGRSTLTGLMRMIDSWPITLLSQRPQLQTLNSLGSLSTYPLIPPSIPEPKGWDCSKKLRHQCMNTSLPWAPMLCSGLLTRTVCMGSSPLWVFISWDSLKSKGTCLGVILTRRPPRLLRPTADGVAWRLSRPGGNYQIQLMEQPICTRLHKGIPVHCILSSGGLDFQKASSPTYNSIFRWTRPAIYATYGPTTSFAWLIPEVLRPSPFHLICRPSLGEPSLPLLNHIQSRRFELFDFDVV